MFAFSGLAKLIPGFPNTMGPPDLEASLTPHGLAAFARFIAVSEVGLGLLLLTRRLATIGAMGLLPMLASILIITTALHWRGTPIVVSGFLVLTLVLLLYDFPKLLALTHDRPRDPASTSWRSVRSLLLWLACAGALLLVLGFWRVERVTALLVLATLIALAALIVLDWRGGPRTTE